MKKLQLLLLLALIEYTFTDDTDKCTTGFEQALKNKCEENIDGSCSYQPSYSEICVSKTGNDCSRGSEDQVICEKIFPNDFPDKKCVFSTSGTSSVCEAASTSCGDFNRLYGFTFGGDRELCGKFKSGINNKICLMSNSLLCTDYFNSCNGLGEGACGGNLLSDYKTECFWNSAASTPSCQSRPRTCDSSTDPTFLLKNVKEGECDQLQSVNSDKKCVYSNLNNQCKAEFISCDKVRPSSEPDCTNIIPLSQKSTGIGYEYDYKHICKFVEASGTTPASCTIKERTCSEYKGDDASICIGLRATETNKRCVFDTSKGIGYRCREEYETCEKYSDNTLRKTRSGCQNLIMNEENVKCLYDIEEDKCVTSYNYTKCDEYEGPSQLICESIKPSAHSRCFLDKDSKCKERAFLCSEVFDKDNCLYYATASISNKRCAYDTNYRNNGHDNICYEEYLRCEDYPEDDSTACNNIKLYDGKKCKFDSKSSRCRTYNKTCSEVNTKEECKLIAKSGVSNPDKKVCLWLYERFGESPRYTYSYTCKETYKYCSDYREGDDYFCENYIKPFNESEDKIDITSKCIYEDSKCEKVPKKCDDTDVVNNPILCSLVSPKIKDNNKMYCAFVGGICQFQFKKCEYWENLAGSTHFAALPTCEDTIPENYLDKPCQTNSENKCVPKDVCNVFSNVVTSSTGVPSITDILNICKAVSHDCEYSLAGCTTKKEYSCSDIKFYTDNEENEEICKNKEASEPYKICSLKEDRSGCEELINLEYSPSGTPPTTSQDSAELISKGINLILITLCLLI